MKPSFDVLVLALMALFTLGLIGFVIYKFVSFRKKGLYRGNYTKLFNSLFDDKFRLN